jgi:hypothetical protein
MVLFYDLCMVPQINVAWIRVYNERNAERGERSWSGKSYDLTHHRRLFITPLICATGHAKHNSALNMRDLYVVCVCQE